MTQKHNPTILWKLRQAFVFAEAVLALFIARLLILFVPLQYWRKSLGIISAEAEETKHSKPLDNATLLRARGISKRVRHAAHKVPFTALCLAQAMAARWMLKRRGIATVMFIGARRGEDLDSFKFHAWLMLGDECLTGQNERKQFNSFAPKAESAK